eukprot:c27458_g1_i1.p1 GENE.c27458_g1_i1~~c27458_g1_i1.p1  ORF type:complete len:160 (+),score=41.23 c27458_g1_i1:123-602(+)
MHEFNYDMGKRDPKYRGYSTRLAGACANGNFDDALTYLNLGDDINELENEGLTPLHWACYGPYISILTELLSRGADVTIKDSNNETPLEWCRRWVCDGECEFAAGVVVLECVMLFDARGMPRVQCLALMKPFADIDQLCKFKSGTELAQAMESRSLAQP